VSVISDPHAAGAAAVRWLPRSWLVLAVGACWLTWDTPYFQLLLSWALPLALVAMTLMSGRPGDAGLPASISPAGFAALAWTINTAALLLLVPVYVLVSENGLAKFSGWTYPFLDKRWLTALYVVGVGIVFVLPVAFRALFDPPEPFVRVDAQRPARLVTRIAGSLVVVAAAWLFAGPPWNVAHHHRPIDFHEQVHLGPLQAIDKGITPFVGPAATQYGPGSQLLTYGYMKAVGGFTVVGYRETTLLFNLVTLIAVGLLAVWLIDVPSALLVMVIALTFSPLSFFRPESDGTFGGAYGWGNALRYLGALIVVPIAVQRAFANAAGRFSPVHLALGAAWGLSAWVAQENLTSTLAGLMLSMSVLWLGGAISFHRLRQVALSMFVGFVAVWTPVVLYYLFHGELAAFVGNYFRVAAAITRGFQNTWWTEGPGLYPAYRYTPFMVAVIAILTVWDLRRLERRTITPAHARLLSFTAVLAACYLTVLYRSDSSHLANTLLPLPFVLVLAFRDLPSWVARSPLVALAMRAGVVAVALWLYPLAPTLSDIYATLIKPSLTRFQTVLPTPATTQQAGVAFDRATQYLQDEPLVVAGSVPMRQFLEEATALHELVGNRRTYLAGMGSVYTGLVYFMADLTPVPGLLERETMQINRDMEIAVVGDLMRLVDNVECLMVREMEMEEAKVFLKAHPNARIEQRPLAGRPVFVLLAN
jgi:hypothetical protein